MWSELIPAKGTTSQDSDVDILLLDCEGLGSEERGFDVATKIFALSIILSSNLVYN